MLTQSQFEQKYTLEIQEEMRMNKVSYNSALDELYADYKIRSYTPKKLVILNDNWADEMDVIFSDICDEWVSPQQLAILDPDQEISCVIGTNQYITRTVKWVYENCQVHDLNTRAEEDIAQALVNGAGLIESLWETISEKQDEINEQESICRWIVLLRSEPHLTDAYAESWFACANFRREPKFYKLPIDHPKKLEWRKLYKAKTKAWKEMDMPCEYPLSLEKLEG